MLRLLAGTVDEAQAAWKPASNRWSVLEVLGHLCHVERFGFRSRLEKILGEDGPSIQDYDPDGYAAAGLYRRPDLKTALDEFEGERVKSLKVLATVKPVDLDRTGLHSALGRFNAGHLLHEWCFHDLGHVRQLAELVRAARYYPRMGPWQDFYTMAP